MQNAPHMKSSFLQLLLVWAEHQASSMKPEYSAGQISAVVAGSGNPPGT
jgi:hypothetical protein